MTLTRLWNWRRVDDTRTATDELIRTLNLRLPALGQMVTQLAALHTDFNVKDYGAVGDGVTDDTVAIQAAIDACAAAGGGEIFAPPGTYLVSPRVHPDHTSVAACLVMQSYCTLKGAGAGATTFKLAVVVDAVPAGCVANWQLHLISNASAYSLSPHKFQINYRDFTIDGNSANQTFVPPNAAHSLYLGKCRGAWVTRVISKNFYGELPGPPGETMHFEAGGCADVHYTDCQAIGDDGNTSTGFSSNVSSFIEYTGCVARNMGVGMGFTHWTAAYIKYVNCHAYSCGYAGFNTEISEHIQYVNCLSGGRGQDSASGVIGDQTPTPNQFGFKVLGSSYVSIIGCNASYNTLSTGYGIYISQYAATAVDSSYVVIDGCTIVANDYGINIVDANQTNIFLTAGNIIVGNTSGLFGPGTGTTATLTRYADAPIESWYATNGTSGVRFNVTTGATTNGYRFLLNGNNCFGIIEQGGVKSEIAFAVPVVSKTTTYTATYADHTILCDATSAAFTVTLPSAASSPGRLYVIKKIDASANVVTVDGNGAELIDGIANYLLTLPMESVRLQSNGTAWYVL